MSDRRAVYQTELLETAAPADRRADQCAPRDQTRIKLARGPRVAQESAGGHRWQTEMSRFVSSVAGRGEGDGKQSVPRGIRRKCKKLLLLMAASVNAINTFRQRNTDYFSS